MQVTCQSFAMSFVGERWKGPTRWLSTCYPFARIYASYLISLLLWVWFKGLQIRPMLLLAHRFSRYRLRKTCLLHDLDPERSRFRATCCIQLCNYGGGTWGNHRCIDVGDVWSFEMAMGELIRWWLATTKKWCVMMCPYLKGKYVPIYPLLWWFQDPNG